MNYNERNGETVDLHQPRLVLSSSGFVLSGFVLRCGQVSVQQEKSTRGRPLFRQSTGGLSSLNVFLLVLVCHFSLPLFETTGF